MKTLLMGMASSTILFLAAATSSWSDEVVERQEKGLALQRQAEELMKAGRKDEANKLIRQAKELLQTTNKPTGNVPKAIQGDIHSLEQKAKELAGKLDALREVAEKRPVTKTWEPRRNIELKIELKVESPRSQTDTSPKASEESNVSDPDDAGRRLKLLQSAAKNLQSAGMHDLARETAGRIEMINREHDQGSNQKQKKQVTHRKRDKQSPSLKELRTEVQQLREELGKIRGVLEQVIRKK